MSGPGLVLKARCGTSREADANPDAKRAVFARRDRA